MTLPQIHSITKKIFVALLGAFLLLFLVFHACANLCVLRHDGGQWYGAFCHFMGTNVIVKVFEIVLLGTFLLHIALTLWLWFTNKMARPTGYHVASRTKTHKGSKLQVWTGILIFACLILHFTDFYFVKLGWTEGRYMVKTEEVMTEELAAMQQASAQYGMSPADFIDANEQQLAMYADQLSPDQLAEIQTELKKLKEALPLAEIVNNAETRGLFSDDHEWITNLGVEENKVLKTAGIETEPDFYYQAREKFSNPIIALLYLVFFVIVWFHVRHAFAAFFQTLGLYNYKYGNAIEVLADIYAWVVCLIFAAVVVLVFAGF